ncbi:MAG TPA: GAF domain-containing protein [Candidatus Aquicultor sp.]|jgi:GAF domain-containing protein
MKQPFEPFQNQPGIEEPWHLRKDFKALLSIMTDISSELDLDVLLRKIIHHAVSLCDAGSGIIFLVDHEGSVVKRYSYNLPESLTTVPIPPGKGVFYEAITTRKTVIVNNYQAYENKIDAFERFGIKAVLATPVFSKQQVIGSIWVYTTSPERSFTAYHARLLEAVAAQAAVAIENARLYDLQRKHQRETEEALNTARILLDASSMIGSSLSVNQIMQKLSDMAANVTGGKRNLVLLYNPRDTMLDVVAGHENSVSTSTRYPCEAFGPELCSVFKPITDVTSESEIPVITKASQQTKERLGFSRALIIPLSVGNHAIGSIIIDEPDDSELTGHEIELISALARQAAVAADNARLISTLRRSSAELRERSKDLQTLLEVTLDITAGLNLNDLMYRIAENASEITGADVAAVGLIDERTGSLTYPFVYNLPEVLTTIQIQTGFGMTGIVIASGKPLVVDDYQQLNQKLEVFAEAGLRATAMVPLWFRHRVMGTLWVSSKDPDKRFNERDVTILGGLGRHAALALENARLYESLRESEEEAQSRARELSILNNLSNALSQTLELDILLNTAIDSLTELLDADGAAIFMLDEARQELVMVTDKGLSQPFVDKSRRIPVGERLPGIVAKEQKPVIIENLAEHPGFEASFVYDRFFSLVGAPIKSKNKVIGVLAFGSRRPGEFTQTDATLLEAIGNELGVAIENSRLYETQRHISESLQRSMLPSRIPKIDKMDVGTRYLSATEEALVGGDFYDIFNTGGKYAMVIGDVSGKGIEAASSTSMIKYVLQSYLYENPSPAYALTEANKVVRRQIEPGVFITVFCAVYDPATGSVTFTNAGHPYPCLLNHANKTCSALTTNDPAVAIIDDYSYSEGVITMHPGDIFTAFTDGVLETRSEAGFFGEERLQNVLLESVDQPAQGIADHIIDACFQFSHGHLTDDIAIVVVKELVDNTSCQ